MNTATLANTHTQTGCKSITQSIRYTYTQGNQRQQRQALTAHPRTLCVSAVCHTRATLLASLFRCAVDGWKNTNGCVLLTSDTAQVTQRYTLTHTRTQRAVGLDCKRSGEAHTHAHQRVTLLSTVTHTHTCRHALRPSTQLATSWRCYVCVCVCVCWNRNARNAYTHTPFTRCTTPARSYECNYEEQICFHRKSHHLEGHPFSSVSVSLHTHTHTPLPI